jgi:DNA-directed RNA polymerase subunit alpha
MISLPSEPKIKEEAENRAVFEIASLYPGYGTTIGNTLRRVLLSSLQGAAVTRVKIEDVQHEFSTIEGIKEDVINIILNLKQLNFKVFSDEPQKATLSVKGEKDVTAADFKFPTQVEIVNGDAPIATLTSKDAKLEMEITIEQGTGFVSAEEMKEGKEEVGQITVDAIFSPVELVNFNVENMRVGERTDFDRLTLEVETNGSISPKDALVKSCDMLKEHFNLIEEPFKDEEEVEKKEKEEEKPKKETKKEKKEEKKEKKGKKNKKEKKEEVSGLDELDLTSRVINILKDNDLTVKDIKKMKAEDLLDLDGIGKKSAERILKAVNQ